VPSAWLGVLGYNQPVYFWDEKINLFQNSTNFLKLSDYLDELMPKKKQRIVING
jgi:hypothetical protein